nr:MAG TPA: hypothetical protein [Caudoviricetes sp.]
MGVRNCADIGENLQKIISRLMDNQNLLKYLYYSDKDPLSNPDLTDEQIKKEIFEKIIKVTPRIGSKETAQSLILVRCSQGSRLGANSEFKLINFIVEIYVPDTQWLIKGQNLRPFAIMGEIQKSLDGKLINGLGKLTGGDFQYNFSSEEMTCYFQNFEVIAYD